MDVRVILSTILGSFVLIFTILGIIFYRKEQAIKKKSTEKTTGKIIGYSYHLSQAPVVEYTVANKTYKQSLKYSYISRFASIFSPIQATTKDDLLDTKLRIQQNRRISFNTLMNDHFPIGDRLTVYYAPDDPSISYVERYAPSYLWLIFIGVSLIFLLIIAWSWLLF